MKRVLVLAMLAASVVAAQADTPQSGVLYEPNPSEQEVAKLKAAALRPLLDPNSAQIDRAVYFRVAEGKPLWMCAMVNAKNRFGGYTGFQPVAVVPQPEKGDYMEMYQDFAWIMCKDRFAHAVRPTK